MHSQNDRDLQTPEIEYPRGWWRAIWSARRRKQNADAEARRGFDMLPLPFWTKRSVLLTGLARWVQITVWAGICFLSVRCGQCATPAELKRQFLQEYEQGLSSLKDCYQHFRATVRVQSIRGPKQSLELEELHKYQVSGAAVMMRITNLTKESDAGRVRVAAPALSFRLRRDSMGQNYSVSNIDNYKSALSGIRLQGLALTAPFGFYETTFQEYLADPSVSITSLSTDTKNDRPIITVSWTEAFRGINRTGRVHFDSEHHWALLGYEIVSRESKDPKIASGMKGIVDYQPGAEVGRCPIVKHAKYWTEKYSDSGAPVLLNSESFEFESFAFEDIPLQEFSLSAFGLRDPNSREIGTQRFWFIAVNVFVILCVVALMAYRRRLS
jgi:hypothetical protein